MNSTIKVILIDDEPLARTLLQEYLQSHPQIEIVATCGDGFQGLKAIQEHQPDLIFLDVQMPKLNGFEMLELLDTPPAVIFTTAFDEYAIKAFDAHAIDYLLKPFSEERLQSAIQKFTDQHKENTITKQPSATPIIKSFQAPRVVVKDNHQIHIIPFTEIIYLEAADDYVKIHTAARYYLKKKTLTFFEESLPASDFCRVHRSYIIAMNQIAKVEPYEKDGAIVTLKTRVEIPVSKAGYVRLKSVLGV
jgi:two-component system, LytTR family, response regulator